MFSPDQEAIFLILMKKINKFIACWLGMITIKLEKGGGSVFMKLFVYLSFIFVLALIRLYNFYNSTM